MHIEARHFQTTSVHREGPIVISVISFEHTMSVHRYLYSHLIDILYIDLLIIQFYYNYSTMI